MIESAYEKSAQQIRNCIDFFDKKFFNKIRLTSDYWIAGGCIRDYMSRSSISDVDFFFTKESDFEHVKSFFLADNAKVLFENENALKLETMTGKVDLVKRFYENPKESISSFDFTVCCAAIDNNKTFYCHDDFFIDLAAKSLQINKLPFPLSTLQRLQKYNKKGFSACNGTLLTIAKALSTLDLTDKNQNVLEFYPDGSLRFVRID